MPDLLPWDNRWVNCKTYVVTIRILPAPSDPKPAGEDVANGSLGLGSRSFTLPLK